jgi:chromosome segregation ATPase
MMVPVKSPRLFTVVIGALMLMSWPGPTRGQDGGQEPGPDAGTRDDAGTDAKRVVRIRRAIELDEERLDWLRSELRARKARFEALATTLTAVAAERDEVRGKLELLDGSERPEVAARAEAWKTELEELEEDVRLLEVQTDLALKAEKIVREQIEALEIKLEEQRVALGRLTGEIPAEARGFDEKTSVLPSTDPGSEATPTPSDAAAPVQSDAERSSTKTAAQRQAEKILEQSELELEIAEQELAEFIERKRALQEQIALEQQLLEGDDKQRKNLETALAAHEDRLDRYRAENASEDKIARRQRMNRRIEKILGQPVRSRDSRVEYIESLKEKLAHLEKVEVRITEEVDEAQTEAQRVMRRVNWLRSPLHPRNIVYWAKERHPRTLLVIVVVALLLLFGVLTARRAARRRSS